MDKKNNEKPSTGTPLVEWAITLVLVVIIVIAALNLMQPTIAKWFSQTYIPAPVLAMITKLGG